MKSKSNNPFTWTWCPIPKLFNVQLHFFNLLSCFILFVCGLSFGVILSFHLKNFSFDLHITQSPLAPGPPPSPPLSLSLPSQWVNSSSRRVGLTEFLKPPSVMHDMDEKELLWRASMTPRIAEYPFDRVPKVAFLFLTKGPVLLAPLWEKFFKGNQGLYSIYVHSDPSFDASSESNTSVFYGRRIPSKEVEWGKVNMIEAERRLFANALLDLSNQRFALMSESCIPLFNFSTVYNYLINSSQTFVESYDLDNPVGRGRYSKKMSPQITLAQWRKGAQWLEIDRDLAIEIVSDQTYFPVFQQHCKDSCYADEHYLPTFVTMKFGKKNSNRTLTWVDWSKGGPHPTKFLRTRMTIEFLEKLRNGSQCQYNGKNTSICHLFARKFLPDALYRLLKFAPTVLNIH